MPDVAGKVIEEERENAEAPADIHVKRVNAAEVTMYKFGDKLVCPIANGTVRQPGGSARKMRA